MKLLHRILKALHRALTDDYVVFRRGSEWDTPKFDTDQPSIDIDELKNVIRKSKQG